MKLSKILFSSLVFGGVGYAASLSVYKDSTFYTFTPQNNFIGFAQNISVKCEGSTIPLAEMAVCPKEDRLCILVNQLESLESEEISIQENFKTLDQLMSLPQPNTLDAIAIINTARLTAEEKTKLTVKANKLKIEVSQEQNQLRKQAPRLRGLKTLQTCKNDIEVKIPFGIDFSTIYEANIIDEKELEVTQYLSITNRSGIDIDVDTAYFYYRSANQYVQPIYFNPWIVSRYVPRSKEKVKTTMMKKARRMDMVMAESASMSGDSMPAVPVASYEDTREYKITNLNLPSTGTAIDVKLLNWKSTLSCEVRAYPYVNTRAFHVCSFEPKYQIESNRWKIKESGIVLNENAVGEYRDKKYTFYTKIEENIQIKREAIVKKEKETGIFGGTARKEDGFTLTLVNKSDKVKKLTIIERIPTSTTDEIKSKLLSLKSDKKIEYKVLADGQIEMQINLVANETKKIEILFEISYDKDLKVSY